MNTPDRSGKDQAPRVPHDAMPNLTALIVQAGKDPTIRQSAPMIWQVAGAAVSTGTLLGKLNWRKANEAFEATKMKTGPGKQGGARMPVSERVQTIAAALLG